MEFSINAIEFNKPELRRFVAKITSEDYKLARSNLELQNKKIVSYFRELYDAGEIKSIFRPKNKKLQSQLNDLIKAKKVAKQSINKINILFS